MRATPDVLHRLARRPSAELAYLEARLSASPDVKGELPSVLREAAALCACHHAVVWTVEPERGQLVPAAQFGDSHAPHAIEAIVAQVGRTSTVAPLLELGVMAAPLVHAGDLFGVLALSRAPASGALGPEHLSSARSLAALLARALHTSTLREALATSLAAVSEGEAELERRIEQRTLQTTRAKQEWERTFDAISEPIALVRKYRILRANVAYARAAGRAVSELPGTTCYEQLAGRTSPCLGCALFADEPLGSMDAIELRPGTQVAVSGFPVRMEGAHGAGGALVVHYRDVTRQRALEARLRESERMGALGQLAAGAAHEINNPLSYLISNLGSLRTTLEAWRTRGGEHDAAELSECADMLEESLEGARRIAGIVRSLSALGRDRPTHGELSAVDASIRRVVARELKGRPEDERLRLSLDAAGLVRLPEAQLDALIGHVLRNADQATEGRGHITVRTFDVATGVVIEVEDDGPGIPSAHLNRVFEPFFTTRVVGQGRGLGLTAAYGLVERCGGHIRLTSAPGRGTAVRIELPGPAAS